MLSQSEEDDLKKLIKDTPSNSDGCLGCLIFLLIVAISTAMIADNWPEKSKTTGKVVSVGGGWFLLGPTVVVEIDGINTPGFASRDEWEKFKVGQKVSGLLQDRMLTGRKLFAVKATE